MKFFVELLTDDRGVDDCPECGEPTLAGQNRCEECVGDFEDGAEIKG